MSSTQSLQKWREDFLMLKSTDLLKPLQTLLIYGEIMQIVIAILFPGPKRKTLNHLNF
jgi:hypothetical protein